MSKNPDDTTPRADDPGESAHPGGARNTGDITPETAATPEDEVLRRRAAALARGISPDRDLWPGIRRAILDDVEPVSDRASGRASVPDPFGVRLARWLGLGASPGWTTVAATAVVVAVASSLITARLRSPEPAAAPPRSAMAAFATLESLRSECARARRDLDAALTQSTGAMLPEAVDVIRNNLAIIDLAIEESQSALAENPANVGLARNLSEDYQQQLALLRKAVRLYGEPPVVDES